MSIRVMSWVWEHSLAEGSALLVELALADYSNDDGLSYPSVASIARKARASRRTVMTTIRDLEAAGRLEVEMNAGPHGVNVYRLITGAGGQNLPGGANGSTKGGNLRHEGGAIWSTGGGQFGAPPLSQIAPDPSSDPLYSEPPVEPSLPSSSGTNFNTRSGTRRSEIAPAVIDAYRATFGDLVGRRRRDLADLAARFSATEIVRALAETRANDGKTLRYTAAILARAGRPPDDGAMSARAQFLRRYREMGQA